MEIFTVYIGVVLRYIVKEQNPAQIDLTQSASHGVFGEEE
jgi:hypothetical protein